MKKILFVMPRFPFPPTSGRKNSLYHYCKILNEELGYEIIVAAMAEKDDDIKLKPNFINKIIELPKISATEKVKNLVSKSILRASLPMQVSLYWSNEIKNMINQIFVEEQPDLVIADMVRCTEYLKDIPKFKIADLDDMISLRYERQLKSDFNSINPYGAYLKTLPRILQSILLFKSIKLCVVKREIKLLKKYELGIGKTYDNTIFVAQGEVNRFNQLLGKEKAVIVPIGVDIDYLIGGDKIEADANYIGFIGALNVAHNESAVINFIENIFPYILKDNKHATFLVIGGNPTTRLLNYASENIIFTGFVNDIRKYAKKCRVTVCPMTFGSGVKTKILESMAMGIPVVTTSIGAENIPALNQMDWIITDNNIEFAKEVTMLLNDDSKYTKYKDAGFTFVFNQYTWENTKKCFEKLLNKDCEAK